MAPVALNAHPTFAAPQAAPAQQPPKKFLEHCVERIDLQNIAELDANTAFYTNIARVIIVSSLVLCVSAFILSGIYYPVLLPVVGILSILVVAPPAAEFMNAFYEDAQRTELEAEKYKKIRHHYDSIQSYTPEQLATALRELQIPVAALPQQIDPLKPLLAFYRYSVETTNLHQQRQQACLEAAQRTLAENGNEQEVFNARHNARQEREIALKEKFSAAMFLAGMQAPNYRGTANDAFRFSDFQPEVRDAYQIWNDPRTIAFVNFKNTRAQPLTERDVATQSIALLAAHIRPALVQTA